MDFAGLSDQDLIDFASSPEAEVGPEPHEQAAAVDRVLAALSSANPQVREQGYGLIWRWTTQELLDPAVVRRLGDRVSEWYDTNHSIQQRCFAPLVHACLAHVGVHQDDWAEAFAAWWVQEPNTIGLHPQLGWLHAVAHGADYVDELALNGLMPPHTLLSWCTARMTFQPLEAADAADSRWAWCAQEDTRLAMALRSIVTTQPGLDLGEWARQLEPVTRFEQPEPIPAAHSNTVRTLRALVSDLAGHDALTPQARTLVAELRTLVALPS